MLTKASSITACFLSLCSMSAFANLSDVVNINASSGNVIHTTEVKTDGETVKAKITLNIGKGGATCQIEKTLGSETFDFKDKTQVRINGEGLARVVGINYTCMEELYEPQVGQPVVIWYDLFNNGKIYTRSEPNYQIVELKK